MADNDMPAEWVRELNYCTSGQFLSQRLTHYADTLEALDGAGGLANMVRDIRLAASELGRAGADVKVRSTQPGRHQGGLASLG